MRLTNDQVRELAVRASLLSGPRSSPDREGILETVRGLGSLQIDPTRTVEKTHLLVLWSRLGAYDTSDLDGLLAARHLFEQQAFIFPRESLAERRFVMERGGLIAGAWQDRMRAWVAANEPFRRDVLARLAAEGPLPSRAFSGATLTHWPSSGWTGGRNVTRMFEWLDARGQVMISGRLVNERLWDIPERILPEFSATEPLSEAAFARRRAEVVTRRMGVATQRELIVRIPFVAKGDAIQAIDALCSEGTLRPVSIEGIDAQAFMHREAEPAADPDPRTTFLSPFDPLIKDRDRTQRLFEFHYRLEMYVPKAERRYGHFVLPILQGDALIGRISPRVDRRASVLHIERVHAEPAAPLDAKHGRSINVTIDDLGRWLGAREVEIAGPVPRGWTTGLRAGNHRV